MLENAIKEAVEKYPHLVQEPFLDIMEDFGFNNLCLLSDKLGGSVIYIPTKKRLFGNCISKSVKEEFDGSNLRNLAKKYELSERTIRNYIYTKK